MDNQKEKVDTVVSANAPIAEAPQTQQPVQTETLVTPAPQKKSSCGLWVLIIVVLLGLLIFCCVCAMAFGGLGKIIDIASNSGASSFDKTQFTQPDSNYNSQSETDPIGDKYDNLAKQNTGKPFSMTISEKDLADQLAKNIDSGDLKDSIYINFVNDKAVAKIELSKVLAYLSAKDSSTNFPIKPEDLKNTYLNVDVEVGSDGKTLQVTNLSTGNFFIDSFLTNDAITAINEPINEGIDNLMSGKGDYEISKIQIKENQIDVNFVPSTTNTP